MADDRPEKSRPSWRTGSRKGPPPERPERLWTRRLDPSDTRVVRTHSRSYKVGAIGLASLACLAGLAILLYILRPMKSVVVVLAGADYATNLAVPHNVAGWDGLGAIEAVARAPRPWRLFSRASLRLYGDGPRVVDFAKDWYELLADLNKAKVREDTILIVAALHGTSDARGAYLLPNRAAGPEDRIPLRDLIRSLDRLPAEKTKILVLDAAQVGADWRQGMLVNEFARRLEELEGDILGVKNLWVLSGCDVDQRCQVSEGLGRTVFTHYLAEALRGGLKEPGPEGPLTLDRLHRAVGKGVARWAWAARGEIQEPVLLPRPAAGKRRGDGSALPAPGEIHLATSIMPGTTAPAPPFERASVAERWRRFRQLESLVPHPAVYSPRRWREYRASMVRFEELSRAGSVDRAAEMGRRLDALDRIIRGERFLGRLSGSAETGLAANVLRGGAASPPPAPDAEFGPFWGAPSTPEAVKQWEKLLAARTQDDDEPRPSARARVVAFLLRQAAGLPDANLARVVDRLEVARGTDFPLPAEAHFTRMLGRSLAADGAPRRASPGFWKVAAQAITAKIEAERAALGLAETAAGYHHAEEVQPWTRATVEEADVLRRRGEDLLFSSERSDWDRAAESLDQARLLHQKASRDAATVREGLAARDLALSDIPRYSLWLAHRPPDQLEDDAVEAAETIWSAAHDLADTLGGPTDPAAIPRIGPMAERVRRGVDRLTERFRNAAPRVGGAREERDFEVATAALAVPFADDDGLTQRGTFWDRLDSIRQGDYERFTRGVGGAPTPDDRAEARRLSLRRSRIQGRMALAALGHSWFDDPAVFGNPDLGGFTRTSEKVRRPIPEDPGELAAWVKDLALAGEQVGLRLQKLPGEIRRLAGDPADVPEDLAAYRGRLAPASRLGRLVDGGAPALAEGDAEPNGSCRRARVHELLLWLAERSWRDHWSNDDPPGQAQRPYYQAAGSLLVDEAARLFPQGSRVRVVRDLLARPDGLRLVPPPPLVVTGEQRLEVAFRVERPVDDPAGLPVVRALTDRLVGIKAEAGGWRTVGADQGAATARFALAGPSSPEREFDPGLNRPRVDSSDLNAELYFRGRRIQARTPVEVHPLPEVVAIGPTAPDPPAARVAIRADDEIVRRFGSGSGSLVIILDCSGSMGVAKFDIAKQALKEVLGQIPEGTWVSLWTFGQAGVNAPDSYPTSQLAQSLNANPRLTIKRLHEPGPWRRELGPALTRRINNLLPFHQTPLLDAMRQALADFKRTEGLKTLLVLTDGNDIVFENPDVGDPRSEMTRTLLNPKLPDPRRDKIRAFVRENFADKGIAANMVFFRTEASELEKAKGNFSGIKEFDPPGQIFTTENLNDLSRALSRSIRQRLSWNVLAQGKEKAVGEPVEVVSGNWWERDLEPGPYVLEVQANRTHRRELQLGRGDRLVVRLAERDDGIEFRRALYSDEVAGAESREAGGSRLSALGAVGRSDRGDDFRMLASLESLEDRLPRLEQPRPRFVWFELAARDARGEPAFALRWHERPYFPAPAWQLDSPRWPADPAGQGLARPVLKAWWRYDEDPAPPARLDLSRFATPGAVDHEVVDLAEGKSVVVESIRLEDHIVDKRASRGEENSGVAASEGEASDREHCLVIRLDYRKAGDPVLVDPAALGAAVGAVGYEHRVYSRARKYAAVFWPVTQTGLEKLRGLDFIELARSRAEAEKQRKVIELDKLGPPKVGGRLPQPLK